MTANREAYKIQIHDGSNVDDIYGLLRFAAATKLQAWDEVQETKGLHHIKVEGREIFIADNDTAIVAPYHSNFTIVNRTVDEMDKKQILGSFDYPRVCKKMVIAKHLSLTVPQLKDLLDGWGYEHVLTDPMCPTAYTQMVIVKTALLSATRAGITARVPIRQEVIRQY